jgi:hypothetical protein
MCAILGGLDSIKFIANKSIACEANANYRPLRLSQTAGAVPETLGARLG